MTSAAHRDTTQHDDSYEKEMHMSMKLTWQLGPDFPEYRKAGALGVIEGTLVYAGGVGPMRPYTSAVQYDPESGGYNKLAGPVKALNWCQGVSRADTLYVVGATGLPAGFATNESYRLFRQSPEGPLVWEDLPGLLYPAMGSAAAASDSVIVCSPGTESFGKIQARRIDEPRRTWYALPDHPNNKKCYEAVAEARGVFYFFGGCDLKKTGRAYYRDAYRLDVEREKWEQIPDLPFPVGSARAASVDDRYVLIFGGVSGQGVTTVSRDNGRSVTGYSKDIIVYDTDEDTYQVLQDSLPFGVASPAVCAINHTIYVVCGESQDRAAGNASNHLQIGTIEID